MITRTGIPETQSPKFAGHETFSLRYGWPKKAVDATAADPLVFTRDEAVIALGVGKNMVRSIRHWGLMTGILEETPEQANNRGRHTRQPAPGTLLLEANELYSGRTAQTVGQNGVAFPPLAGVTKRPPTQRAVRQAFQPEASAWRD
jgi:hypothetical protein